MWSTNDLRTWTVSSGLPLDGAALVSTGITGPGGFVVTVTGAGSPTTASVVSPTGAPQWERLAALPTGTTSVTGTPGGGFDALVPANSVLSVYATGVDGVGPAPETAGAHPVRIVGLTGDRRAPGATVGPVGANGRRAGGCG